MTVQNRWQLLTDNSGISPGQPISATSRTAKSIAKKGALATSTAMSVAQTATHTPNLALVAAGAAASATGIGLIVVGTAATLTISSLAARSAYKSWQHCKALDKIYDHRQCYECKPLAGGPDRVEQHNKVADEVLPYICLQKSEKTGRKALGAVPVLGFSETLYAMGRAVFKSNKGVKRKAMASILAEHLITHNCGLAQAIVADLYSFEEMSWILQQDYDDVVTLLFEKMASR